MLDLCGSGWKVVYHNAVANDCARLNTPKFGNISTLMNDWLGVNIEKLESAWTHTKEELNEFVTRRGEIAHRGADALYVRRSALGEYCNLIDQFTVDTDNFLRTHLCECVGDGRRPWNRIPVH